MERAVGKLDDAKYRTLHDKRQNATEDSLQAQTRYSIQCATSSEPLRMRAKIGKNQRLQWLPERGRGSLSGWDSGLGVGF